MDIAALQRSDKMWQAIRIGIKAAALLLIVTSCKPIHDEINQASPDISNQVSPLSSATVPLTFTPTAPTEVWSKYQGHTIYGPDSPLFEVTYNSEVWSFTKDNTGYGQHRLVDKQVPQCYLMLMEGAREYVSLGQVQLGSYLWGISETIKPNYFVYNTVDKLDAFIFGLQLPGDASAETRTACRQKLEAILATFRVVQR